MTSPLAIDYRFPVAHYRNAEPLPPVPEGWTRLLAEDYSAGDEWEDVTRPLTDSEFDRLGDPSFTELLTTDADGNYVMPIGARQTASGVCREYQRRADEWAAQQPAQAPAPEPVPAAVTRRQLLLELNASTPRITFANIEAVLPSLGLSETALEDAYIELENAQTFERQHPLVAIIKAVFGVDDAWCDDRWRGAAKR